MSAYIRAPRNATYAPRPVTDPQKQFILDLLRDRDTRGTKYEGWKPDWSKANSSNVGQVIDYLKTLPFKPQPKVEIAGLLDIEHARYALRGEDGVKFYRVDRPSEGKWAGRIFIKVQAGDELFPLKSAQASAVLAEIAKDAKAALLLYGLEIGACGHCGRTLTNEESRARGIGPVCAEKAGF